MTWPQRVDIELCLAFDDPQPLPALAPGEVLEATATPVLYTLAVDDDLAALIAVPGVCIRCATDGYVDVQGLCETCRCQYPAGET